MSAARLSALAAVALAASVAVGACGDDDSGSAPVASPEAIERANAICRKGQREAQRLGAKGLAGVKGEGDLDVITEAFVKPGIPLLEGQGAQLRRAAADTDDAVLKEYAALYDVAAELSRERVRASEEGDINRAEQATSYTEQLGVDGQEAAREAGFGDCDLDFQRAVVDAAGGK